MSKLIPDDFIRDLIARTNIVDIVSQRVKLKKKGINYFGCCPFHNEKTPSFSVNEKKQFFYCFGCGASGSVIEFLKQSEHLSFPEAIEELASIHGLDVPYSNAEKGSTQVHRNQRATLYQLTEKVKSHYQACLALPQADAARQYLANRNLTEETIQSFGLGYALPGWQTTLDKIVHSQEELQFYEQAGLLVTQEGNKRYDRFRDRIMFPIRDRQGHVVAFGGRVLDQSEPKYLNSPETPIFHKSRILYGLYEVLEKHNTPSRLMIVEGYMDVISLAQAGVDYAVASLGTATTTEHIQLLFRHTDTVICCYDGDNAGRRAAWRTLNTALPILDDGQQLQFLFLPDGEDPDSLVKKEGKTAFEERLINAQSLPDFLFDTLTQQTDIGSQAGRSKLGSLAIPMIQQVKAKTLSIFLKEQLSYKLRINNMASFDQLFEKTESDSEPSPKPAKMKLTTMRIVIGLLVQNPELAKHISHPDELTLCDMAGIALFIDLLKTCHAHPGMTSAQLLETYRDSPSKKQLETLAIWNHMYKEEAIESAFLSAVRELYDTILMQRLNTLLTKESSSGLTAEERKEVWEINLALSKTKKAHSSSE